MLHKRSIVSSSMLSKISNKRFWHDKELRILGCFGMSYNVHKSLNTTVLWKSVIPRRDPSMSHYHAHHGDRSISHYHVHHGDHSISQYHATDSRAKQSISGFLESKGGTERVRTRLFDKCCFQFANVFTGGCAYIHFINIWFYVRLSDLSMLSRLGNRCVFACLSDRVKWNSLVLAVSSRVMAA